jgi:hypothetical protein
VNYFNDSINYSAKIAHKPTTHLNDGYLVVLSAEMDVFLGLGHLEQVRKAEKKFVATARAFWDHVF